MLRVCFVCSSSSKRQMQRCFTVPNQRSLHRLIVKLQLPFFSSITDSSLRLSFFSRVLSASWRGKGKGRRVFQHCGKAQHRKYYTHWFPLFLIHKETRHSPDSTLSFLLLFSFLFLLSKGHVTLL